MYACAAVCIVVGGQPAGIGPSLLASEPQDGTHVARLGDKCLYPLSCLKGPICLFFIATHFCPHFQVFSLSLEQTSGWEDHQLYMKRDDVHTHRDLILSVFSPISWVCLQGGWCYFRAFGLSISSFPCVDKTKEPNPFAGQTTFWYLITSDSDFFVWWDSSSQNSEEHTVLCTDVLLLRSSVLTTEWSFGHVPFKVTHLELLILAISVSQEVSF